MHNFCVCSNAWTRNKCKKKSWNIFTIPTIEVCLHCGESYTKIKKNSIIDYVHAWNSQSLRQWSRNSIFSMTSSTFAYCVCAFFFFSYQWKLTFVNICDIGNGTSSRESHCTIFCSARRRCLRLYFYICFYLSFSNGNHQNRVHMKFVEQSKIN